jgi:hypothetical protein
VQCRRVNRNLLWPLVLSFALLHLFRAEEAGVVATTAAQAAGELAVEAGPLPIQARLPEPTR